jgi:small-conductance mechanosensitive channel
LNAPPASPAPALTLPFLGRIADERLAGIVLSAIVLGAAYLVAALVTLVVGRVLMARARRTPKGSYEHLVRSLRRPLGTALFLLGAVMAVGPLPLPESWLVRIARLLFSGAVVAATVALVRAWRLILHWWATDPTSGEEKPWARDFSPLLTKVGGILIALFGLITLLKGVGVDVNSLVVSLGVGSLAVGLAAQDTLANMFAGFTLLLDRPFRIGERIQLATGEVGDVDAIGLRATRLRTADETLLVIPNSLLTKEKVVNLSSPSRTLTTRIEVGVPYGSDLAQVKEILRAAVFCSKRVEPTREPIVLLVRLAEFSVNFRVVFWVTDYVEQAVAMSEVYEEIYKRMAEAGIEIPYPVRRVIQVGPAEAAPS